MTAAMSIAERNAMIEDEALGAAMNSMFEEDIARSNPMENVT